MRKILSLVLGLLWVLPVWGANCNLFDISQSPTRENISSDYIWTRYNINVSSASLSAGTWTARHTDFISPGTYTITINGSQTEFGIRGYDGSNLSVLRRGNGSFTITNPSQIWIFGANPETIAQITEIMLEQGSTATPYQPYNATCDDRCKNLFDKAQTPYNSGTYISSATVGQTGFSTDVNTNYNVYRIKVQPNTTYTFGKIKASQPYWVVTDSSNKVLQTAQNNGGTEGVDITITTEASAKYLYLSVSINGTYKCIDILQLEQGSTATEYVPYNAACHNNKITIATTKYNESAFGPLNTALANAISVVDTVVSNTITQAASIATLQTQKQTRPNDIADDNEKCPAGKKCLLVEDASGVPHWYEIVENAWDLPAGYTQLEYIKSTGAQWIDTGYVLNSNTDNVEIVFQADSVDTNINLFGARYSTTSKPYTFGAYQGGWRFGWYDRSEVFGTADTNKHTVKIEHTGGILKIDDVIIAEMGSESFTTPFNAALFGVMANSMYYGTFTIYSYKKWTNDELVQYFIPAQRNSDNVLGMYDLVSGQFFTNQGTGSFVAGPVAQ